MTLPNQIWVEPGGRRALIFRGATPSAAAEAAAAFVGRDSLARGHRLAEPGQEGDALQLLGPASRLVKRYSLRYVARGTLMGDRERRTRSAETANLSETGLFIATEETLVPGSRLSIDLRLPGLQERLDGVVVWSRHERAPGLDPGLGVRLVDPPLSYRAKIQSLR